MVLKDNIVFEKYSEYLERKNIVRTEEKIWQKNYPQENALSNYSTTQK